MKTKVTQYSYLICLAATLLLSDINPLAAQIFHNHEAGLSTTTLTHQNNLQLDLLLPIQDKGANFSIAYSPIKHIGIYGGIMSRNDNGKSRIFKGQNYTVGTSFYYVLTKPTRRDPSKVSEFNFSLNTGYSKGSIKSQIRRFISDFDFEKFYIQAGAGYNQNGWGVNFFLKFNRLSYLDGAVDLRDGIPNFFRYVEEINTTPYFNTLEYKIRIQGGRKMVKGFLGASIESHLTNQVNSFLDHEMAYIGLSINIDRMIELISKKKND